MAEQSFCLAFPIHMYSQRQKFADHMSTCQMSNWLSMPPSNTPTKESSAGNESSSCSLACKYFGAIVTFVVSTDSTCQW